MRVKELADPVEQEPPRSGEDANDCISCNTPDEAYIWVSERWRVRAMDRPTGLPIVLILECRSHLDLGDLPNLLAAELGVMTVRLERAVRSLDGVARVHVNRWGDGAAHLHMWFLARPYGRLQLRGTFLSLWDDILPVIPEWQWRENLALVAAWLAEFGGTSLAEPPHIQWQSPSTIGDPYASDSATVGADAQSAPVGPGRPDDLADVEAESLNGDTQRSFEHLDDRSDAPTKDLSTSPAKLPGGPGSHGGDPRNSGVGHNGPEGNGPADNGREGNGPEGDGPEGGGPHGRNPEGRSRQSKPPEGDGLRGTGPEADRQKDTLATAHGAPGTSSAD
jgi:diadenosine tetraphosphate (Ap4A) HIT family hydrolase